MSCVLQAHFQEKKWKQLKTYKTIKWSKEAVSFWSRDVASNGGWKLSQCGKERLNVVTKLKDLVGAMGSLCPAAGRART